MHTFLIISTASLRNLIPSRKLFYIHNFPKFFIMHEVKPRVQIKINDMNLTLLNFSEKIQHFRISFSFFNTVTQNLPRFPCIQSDLFMSYSSCLLYTKSFIGDAIYCDFFSYRIYKKKSNRTIETCPGNLFYRKKMKIFPLVNIYLFQILVQIF